MPENIEFKKFRKSFEKRNLGLNFKLGRLYFITNL